MYDPRNEPHEFFGDGRQDAIDKACKFYGVEAGELSVVEFDAGEIYGAASRTVIVAVPESVRTQPRPSEPREARGERGGRGDRDRGRRERRDRGDRDRGDRGDRDRDRDRGDRDRDRGRGRGRRDTEERRAAEPIEPSGPSIGKAEGELGELGSFVLGLVERMDLGPFEVSETEEEELLVVHVRGEAAARLATGEARAADALQLIANQAGMRMCPDRQRVVVDVEGDADSREAHLTSLADRIASRARRSGRAVAVDPMNPRDRRMIHLALRDVDGIATMSIGEGRYRQVVVVPEGAPEYEEACREAEAAADRSDD